MNELVLPHRCVPLHARLYTRALVLSARFHATGIYFPDVNIDLDGICIKRYISAICIPENSSEHHFDYASLEIVLVSRATKHFLSAEEPHACSSVV